MSWEPGRKGPRPAPEERLVAKLRRLAHWVVSGEFSEESDAVDGGTAEGTGVDEQPASPGHGKMKSQH